MLAWFLHDTMGQDLYFDEMWRVDMIRTVAVGGDLGERLDLHDTPFPIGWAVLNGLLVRVLGVDGVPGIRMLTLIPGPVLCGATVFLLWRLADRLRTGSGGRDRWFDRAGLTAWRAATVGAIVVLPCLPVLLDRSIYVNNYLAEAAYVLVLLALVEALERSRWAWFATLGLIAASPIVLLSGLLALPAIVVAAWRTAAPTRGRRLLLGGSVAVAAILAVGLYLSVYAEMGGQDTVQSGWEDDQLGTAPFDVLIDRTARGLVNGVVPFDQRAYGTDTPWAMVAAAVTLVVVGGITLGRRWHWMVSVPASAWALAAVASPLVGWPVTLARTNVPFLIAIWVYAVFGLFILIGAALERLSPPGRRARVGAGAVAASVGLVFAILLVARPRLPDPDAWARGLTPDLESVRTRIQDGDVILAYHRMAHFYSHDAFVNRATPGVEVDVVPERLGDRAIYDDPLGLIARHGDPDPSRVWCVIPYTEGRFADACDLGDRYQVVESTEGVQARIVELRRSW